MPAAVSSYNDSNYSNFILKFYAIAMDGVDECPQGLLSLVVGQQGLNCALMQWNQQLLVFVCNEHRVRVASNVIQVQYQWNASSEFETDGLDILSQDRSKLKSNRFEPKNAIFADFCWFTKKMNGLGEMHNPSATNKNRLKIAVFQE